MNSKKCTQNKSHNSTNKMKQTLMNKAKMTKCIKYLTNKTKWHKKKNKD